MKFVVMVRSVRSDRQGIKAARFVERELSARGHDVTLVDPCEVRLPLLDRIYKEYPKGQAPATLERLADLYRASEGFVVVSGEYNHTIPPALTNLLDHFLEEYFFRPSAIVCYSTGQLGGVRAAMQLRALLGELGMPSISRIFPIPAVGKAFTDALQVLQRSRPRWVRFAKADRWLRVVLSRIWTGWRTALVIVTPETVIAWHRRGFRRWWAWKSRARMGRPTVRRTSAR